MSMKQYSKWNFNLRNFPRVHEAHLMSVYYALGIQPNLCVGKSVGYNPMFAI